MRHHVHVTLALGMQAKFSILLQWLRCIIDNRPHNENLDSLTINDIRNGIYATDTLHNHYFNPRDVAVLKVCPPFSSARSPLKIMSDTKSYPPNHRRPREVPAQYTHESQLPNQLTIYAPMDCYAARPNYPGPIPKQQ